MENDLRREHEIGGPQIAPSVSGRVYWLTVRLPDR